MKDPFPRFHLGLRFRLAAAFIGLVTATFLPAGYVGLRSCYESLRSQKQQDELVIARNIAAQVDETLAKAKETVRALAEHPDVQGADPSARRRALTLVVNVTELIDGLFLTDAAGNVLERDLAAPRVEGLLPADVAGEFLRPALLSRKVPSLRVARTKAGELVAGITAPVQGGKRPGEFVIGVILLRNHSMGGIEDIRIGKSGYAFLVDDQRRIIVHPQREKLLEDISQPVRGLADAGRGGVTGYVNAEGLSIGAAFAPVRETGWGVVVRQPTSESYAFANSVFKKLVFLFVAALAAAMAAGIFLAGRIAGPVTALVKGVRGISAGNLDARIPPSGLDEIGALGQAFNLMTSRLKEHLAETARAHQEVLEAERRLAQSEKLAAVGQLAAGLAHEINNPLNIISGFAEVLLEKAPPEDPARGPLMEIGREAGRCQRLIRDLLHFAKPRASERGPCDVGVLLGETLALVKPQARSRGIEVLFEAAPGVPEIEADRDQLKQVFLNLALNACQAMPSGGLLAFRVRPADRGIEVSVADTGSGIAPEHMKDLFNPFFTTREDGTGLGLATSYATVERHGGRIEVSSEKGRGTVFRVLLPSRGGAGA